MSAERNFTDQDYELLSAYLDGALPDAERTALEARLLADDSLRGELESLRQTVNLVGGLSPIKAPRNFTLTPSMVRERPGHWLIFPTSAAFSTVTAAAATILILFGAGLLLLQSNTLMMPGAPSREQPAAIQQESQSQVAIQPTLVAQTIEKTADDNAGRIELTASALGNLLSVPTTPTPAPTLLEGFAAPEISNAPSSEGAGGAIAPAQPPAATASSLSYGLPTQTTLDEEQADQILQLAPMEATGLAAATMVMAAPPAAYAAAQSGVDAGEQAANTQSGAEAEAMADQALMVTGTPDPTLNRDLFALLTATAPGVDGIAMSTRPTPSPNPTLAPTATITSSATPAPSPTIIAAAVTTEISEPVDRVSDSSALSGAIFAPLIVLIGLILLILAGITTFVRRRGR